MGLINKAHAYFADNRAKHQHYARRSDIPRHQTFGSRGKMIHTSLSSLRHRTKRFLRDRGKAVPRHVSDGMSFVQSDISRSDFSSTQSVGVSECLNEASGVSSGRYVPLRHLAEGGNGDVHLCRDTEMGTLVAVKTIHHDELMSPPNEVVMLHLLGNHGNIVHYHTMCNHPVLQTYMQLIFEYCPMGDLVDYLNEQEHDPPEMFMWHVFKHVALGLNYMHQHSIVHGDIKPANILLTAPREGELYPLPKIADFGTAALKPPHNIPRGHVGTTGYQPPESEHHYGPEADVWALGSVIHEMASTRPPTGNHEVNNVEAQLWFQQSGKQVPPGTAFHCTYKNFCYFMACHPPSPVRIDHPSTITPTVYSKLLNYFMMRALDPNHQTRITTYELHHTLPVIEWLVRNVLTAGYDGVLDSFDDGRDAVWTELYLVTDSQVLRQVFHVLAQLARQNRSVDLLSWATRLLQLMDPMDQVAACHFAADLGICVTS
jgi:serine/threonine protein kinase